MIISEGNAQIPGSTIAHGVYGEYTSKSYSFDLELSGDYLIETANYDGTLTRHNLSKTFSANMKVRFCLVKNYSQKLEDKVNYDGKNYYPSKPEQSVTLDVLKATLTLIWLPNSYYYYSFNKNI